MAILNSAQLNSSISNPEGVKVNITTLSNTQRINKVDTDIVVEKLVEKNWAIPNDEILVTTKITNNMDVNLEDFHFQDTLSAGATFVDGTVKVGQEEKPDLNPLDGFDLAVTIGALGGECEVSYKIRIDQHPEVSSVSLSTTISLTLESQTFNVPSNTAQITIADNEIYLLKTASPNAVKSGDEITYTIQITNSGTIENSDLYFIDKIPDGTTFVSESVKVNGSENPTANPDTGFSLNNILPQDQITIEFKVRVT